MLPQPRKPSNQESLLKNNIQPIGEAALKNSETNHREKHSCSKISIWF